MALTQQDILLIEKYLSNALDKKEVKVFKSRLLDPEFEEEVQLYQRMSNASLEIERDGLKKTFKEWDNSSNQKQVGNLRIFRLWPVAASVLLLIGLSTIWYISDKSINSNQIFEQYYQPFDNLIDPISKSVEDRNPSISQLYELGQFQNTLSKQVTDSLQAFYKTLALIELDRVQEVIPVLITYANQKSFRFREAAQWYLALSYLKLDELNKVNELLQKIVDTPEHDFNQVASKVLDRINK